MIKEDSGGCLDYVSDIKSLAVDYFRQLFVDHRIVDIFDSKKKKKKKFGSVNNNKITITNVKFNKKSFSRKKTSSKNKKKRT